MRLSEVQQVFGYRGGQRCDAVHLRVLTEKVERATGVEERGEVCGVLSVSSEGVDHRLVHEGFERRVEGRGGVADRAAVARGGRAEHVSPAGAGAGVGVEDAERCRIGELACPFQHPVEGGAVEGCGVEEGGEDLGSLPFVEGAALAGLCRAVGSSRARDERLGSHHRHFRFGRAVDRRPPEAREARCDVLRVEDRDGAAVPLPCVEGQFDRIGLGRGGQNRSGPVADERGEEPHRLSAAHGADDPACLVGAGPQFDALGALRGAQRVAEIVRIEGVVHDVLRNEERRSVSGGVVFREAHSWRAGGAAVVAGERRPDLGSP